MTRAAGVLLMFLVWASTASAGALVLDHDALTARARKARGTANIVYTPSFALRFKLHQYGLWWPVRVEGHFIREGKVVRIKADRVLASGMEQPSKLAEADAKLGLLVNVETAADTVQIMRKGVLVFQQTVGAPPALPPPAPIPRPVVSPEQ